MANGIIRGPCAPPFFGTASKTPDCASEEVEFKLALTGAAAQLRAATASLAAPYDVQLLNTAKLLEAMAGEAEA